MEQTTENTPPPEAGAPEPGFWGWLRGLGINRSDDDRWLGGVAGGIAARTGLDPLIWRGIFLALLIFGGPAVVLYLVCWLLLPDSSGRIHLEDVFTGRASTGVIITAVVGLAVVAFGLLGIAGQTTILGIPGWWGSWSPWGGESALGVFSVFWWIGIVGATVWFIFWALTTSRSGKSSDPAHPTAAPGRPGSPPPDLARPDLVQPAAGSPTNWQPPPESWEQRTEAFAESVADAVEKDSDDDRAPALDAAHTVLTLGLALLIGGASVLLGVLELTDLGPQETLTLGIALGVAVLGISCIVAGLRGRRTGWIGFLALIGVIWLLFATVIPRPNDARLVAREVISVSNLAEAGDYSVAALAANTTLDLRGLDRAGAELGREVTMLALAGNVTLELPDRVPVRVQTRALAGGTTYEHPEGWPSQQTTELSGPLISTNTAHCGVPAACEGKETTVVTVWLGAGTTTVVEGGQHER